MPNSPILSRPVIQFSVFKSIFLPAFLLINLLFVPSAESQDSKVIYKEIAWHPNGEIIAAATTEEVWLYTSELEPITELSIDEDLEPIYLEWNPAGTKLAAAAISRSGEDRIYIWNVSGNTPNLHVVIDKTMETDGISIGGMTWSPDTRLAIAYGPTEIHIWDTETGTLIQRLDPEGNVAVEGMTWSPDGLRLTVGALDDVRVFDMAIYQEVYALEGQLPKNASGEVVWSPTGNLLAVSEGASIFIWEYDANTDSFQPITTLTQSPQYVWRLDWQGDRLAATPSDRIIRVWDTTNWEVVNTLPFSTFPKAVGALALSPDGTQLAYVNQNDVLEIAEISTEE